MAFPKNLKPLVLALATCALTAASASAQHAPSPAPDHSRPDPRTLPASSWQSDLRFLAESIEQRHPDPFHSISRAG